jgi:hypothetical protein
MDSVLVQKLKSRYGVHRHAILNLVVSQLNNITFQWGLQVMLPSACSFIVDVSCHCPTLNCHCKKV